VNVVPLDGAGVNYGWNVVEGPECYRSSSCDRTGFEEPVLTYDHGDGCSITGGFVYRGTRIEGLAGTYFYSDYCEGWLRSFRWNPDQGGITEQREWSIPDVGNVYSFGEDADGELYVLAGDGVWRLDPGLASR
jgi:hypothetical protein